MIAELITILGPLSVVALGALVCIGSEPFIADARKHAVLPWVGTLFCALAGVLQVTVAGGVVDVHGLFAIDPVRVWLGLTVILCAATALAGLQHSLGRDGHPGGEGYALVLLAAVGAMLMVNATDYLALFVGLELTSISIYSTVALRRHRLDSGEAMLKYFVMGAVFSAILLYGMALSYGATGSTAYSALALPGRDSLLRVGQTLILVGLLFKLGAVPFHFWSPDAYTGAPVPITGFMAAVVKVGAFAALGAIWLSQMVANGDPSAVGSVIPLDRAVRFTDDAALALDRHQQLLAGAAILSLLVGNFSALGQTHLRRLMAFSSISHAGFMLLAFALPAELRAVSLTGLWFYVMAYAVATAGTMTAAAVICGREDSDRLSDLTGAGRRHPLLGLGLSVLVASMAGLPPTAGFLGKYLIFADLVAKGQVLLALLGMLMAVVGAVYYLRFVISLWSGEGQRVPERGPGGLAWAAVVVTVIVTFGLLAAPELGAGPTAGEAPVAALP